MKKIDVILGFILVFAMTRCDKENQGSSFRLKNGSYMGSFNYDNKQLWESFIIRNDSFVEVASGGVMFQKFPKYCLTEGTFEIIDDSIYFKNIQVAQPPNGIIVDYQKEFVLMGSYFIEEYSDSSIVFSRKSKNGSQKYNLRLYYETE